MSFYGLEIARTGIFVNRKGLEVTSHNVANASTPGYTRQVLNVKSNPPSAKVGFYSPKFQVGMGADVQSLEQIRDMFLDIQYRNEYSRQGEYEIKADNLNFIESIFNEPSDTGLSSVIDQFFSSLQELSKNPESLTVRALVRQRAQALTDAIHKMYKQLEDLQSELNDQVYDKILEINSIASQIADLNQQIFVLELRGEKANDLRDQRNLLVDKLSKIVDTTAYEDKDGRFIVQIAGGETLVNHFTVYELETDKSKIMRKSGFDSSGLPTGFNPDDPLSQQNLYDVPGLFVVMWKDTGQVLNIKSGELKGLLDMRDGVGGLDEDMVVNGQPVDVPNKNYFTGIPYYLNRLNEFAQKLIEKFNELHTQGWSLNGQNTNINFFEPPVGQTFFYARYIKVSDAVMNDLNNIATTYDASSLPGGNDLVVDMLKLRNDNSVFKEGKFEDFLKSLISNLGVDSQGAKNFAENQKVMVTQLDNRRQAVSGVSIDEEMTNLIRYQHGFQASARMINAFDEMLDVIVNRLGLVGR
ncbi:flagellar hook-associated protein FlgK [Caldicellulosiruptor kronotskyensis 2002]|uniref:Flagellar hook-associated protein 1 n=1 Tax=Caldicellulosiruptor kronotskyensis (strain DSM 18902 / VKM B-2412 / 2002) TaxID=632348 RepID=E4SCH6_CALK2|nr:flagellar hook-associated protein FlgK [Caldicellulosiruptor kronotskyensis]ADQ45910.1 flagellar hook-associated protein FlgK [Caldicellulosiruptor kronotskyensis 2002]